MYSYRIFQGPMNLIEIKHKLFVCYIWATCSILMTTNMQKTHRSGHEWGEKPHCVCSSVLKSHCRGIRAVLCWCSDSDSAHLMVEINVHLAECCEWMCCSVLLHRFPSRCGWLLSVIFFFQSRFNSFVRSLRFKHKRAAAHFKSVHPVWIDDNLSLRALSMIQI